MATAAQIAANRANAQKSTGPKTEEGRIVCRMNACTHGLAGDTVLMPWEDAQAYKAHCDAIIAGFAPEGAEEQRLAQTVADCYWRLNRASAVDTNMFSMGVLDYAPGPGVAEAGPQAPKIHAAICQARAFDAHSKSWVNLTLYEQRIYRTLEKSRALLVDIQSNRELAEGMERARLIADAQRARYEKQMAEKQSAAPAAQPKVAVASSVTSDQALSPRCAVKEKHLSSGEFGFVYSSTPDPAPLGAQVPPCSALLGGQVASCVTRGQALSPRSAVEEKRLSSEKHLSSGEFGSVSSTALKSAVPHEEACDAVEEFLKNAA